MKPSVTLDLFASAMPWYFRSVQTTSAYCLSTRGDRRLTRRSPVTLCCFTEQLERDHSQPGLSGWHFINGHPLGWPLLGLWVSQSADYVPSTTKKSNTKSVMHGRSSRHSICSLMQWCIQNESASPQRQVKLGGANGSRWNHPISPHQSTCGFSVFFSSHWTGHSRAIRPTPEFPPLLKYGGSCRLIIITKFDIWQLNSPIWSLTILVGPNNNHPLVILSGFHGRYQSILRNLMNFVLYSSNVVGFRRIKSVSSD